MNRYIINLLQCIKKLVFISCLCCVNVANSSELESANNYFEDGNYNKSIYYYLKHLSLNAATSEAQLKLATCYIHTSQHAKALKYLDALLNVNHANEVALNLRASSFAVLHEWHKLILDAESLVQINPLNKQAYMYMDIAYIALGDTDFAAQSMARYKAVSELTN